MTLFGCILQTSRPAGCLRLRGHLFTFTWTPGIINNHSELHQDETDNKKEQWFEGIDILSCHEQRESTQHSDEIGENYPRPSIHLKKKHIGSGKHGHGGRARRKGSIREMLGKVACLCQSIG